MPVKLAPHSWKYAFGELLVVFVGILSAVQVDRWIEHRREQAILQDYLTRIIVDLESDAETLEGFSDQAREGQAAVDSLLAWMGGEHARPADTTLRKTVNSAWGGGFPTDPRRGTYNDMLSTGSLRLIDDTELRAALIEYHENFPGPMLRGVMEYREQWEINPTAVLMYHHLDARVLGGLERPLFVTDWDSLAGDEALATRLRTLSAGHRAVEGFFSVMAARSNELRTRVIDARGESRGQPSNPAQD